MPKQTSKLTYLLTFNVNIYAETNNPQTSGECIEDHNGCHIIQYKKGDTLEISEEAFIKFIEYGGMSNQTKVAFTGEQCITRFKTEHIESVAKKQVWMEISNYVNTIDESIGIKAWAESRRAAYLVDEFNGDSCMVDKFNRNKKETIIARMDEQLDSILGPKPTIEKDMPGFEGTKEAFESLTIKK
jgi:predicted RNA-binding protein Jag